MDQVQGWTVLQTQKYTWLRPPVRDLAIKGGPLGPNPGDIKEGCAERIARFGTLSQNGYGDNKGRSKGTDPGALQFRGTDTPALDLRPAVPVKKPTAPEGFPARSPTAVLTGPSVA